MRKPPYKRSLLSVAIMGGLIAAMPQAKAVELYTESSYWLPTGTDFDTDADANSVYSSVYSYDYPNSADTAGSANDTGWIYSRSGGEGYFESESTVSLGDAFTNTSGVAQNYFFDFTINRGSISAYEYMDMGGDEFVLSGYEVSILLNGSAIWESTASISQDSSGSSDLQLGGVYLGVDYSDDSYYSWDEYSNTLNLGVINAGESFDLQYSIRTYAMGDTGTYDCGGYYEGYGDGYGEVASLNGYGDGYGECAKGYSYAQFGDPNQVSSMPISNNQLRQTPANGVPEPASLALLTAGLGGLAAARRRKQKQG